MIAPARPIAPSQGWIRAIRNRNAGIQGASKNGRTLPLPTKERTVCRSVSALVA